MLRHREIMDKLHLNKKIIDISGIITYNPRVLNITFSIIVFNSIIKYIFDSISHIKTCKFALHQNTLYSKFVEYILQLNKQSYHKIYNHHISNISYMVNDTTIEINPNINDFLDKEVQLIPLSNEELIDLENHTGMNNLVACQNKILNMITKINAYNIVTMDDYDGDKITKIENNIINDTFQYNILLSDYIEPLEIGDIINSTFYNVKEQDIYIENTFVLNQYYKLTPLSENLYDDVNQLPFYSLEYPRKLLRFHPFHLPKTVDIVLSLMILTQACIDA